MPTYPPFSLQRHALTQVHNIVRSLFRTSLRDPAFRDFRLRPKNIETPDREVLVIGLRAFLAFTRQPLIVPSPYHTS